MNGPELLGVHFLDGNVIQILKKTYDINPYILCGGWTWICIRVDKLYIFFFCWVIELEHLNKTKHSQTRKLLANDNVGRKIDSLTF